MAPGADAILRRWQREAAMAARARAFICLSRLQPPRRSRHCSTSCAPDNNFETAPYFILLQCMSSKLARSVTQCGAAIRPEVDGASQQSRQWLIFCRVKPRPPTMGGLVTPKLFSLWGRGDEWLSHFDEERGKSALCQVPDGKHDVRENGNPSSIRCDVWNWRENTDYGDDGDHERSNKPPH